MAVADRNAPTDRDSAERLSADLREATRNVHAISREAHGELHERALRFVTAAFPRRILGRRITGTGAVEISLDGGTTWTSVVLTEVGADLPVAPGTVAQMPAQKPVRSGGFGRTGRPERE